MNPTKINAPKIIAGSFLGIIAIGAILLSLPISTVQEGSMPVIDALFTSTSAVCVTGLAVVDIGTYFTKFGQIVLIILMQAGGLGIMTLSTFFLILFGKRLQMKDLFVIEGSVGQEVVHGVKGLVKYILVSTFGIEFIGVIVFFLAQFLGNFNKRRNAGQIVISHSWMAKMCDKNNCFFPLSFYSIIADFQIAFFKF